MSSVAVSAREKFNKALHNNMKLNKCIHHMPHAGSAKSIPLFLQINLFAYGFACFSEAGYRNRNMDQISLGESDIITEPILNSGHNSYTQQ